MNTKRHLLCALSALMTVFSGSASALDTDIYLKAPSIVRDDSANVLIILDDSSSMPGNLIVSKPYDPATTYQYLGAGQAFATDKIYWKINTQTEPASGVTYPGQWFSVANNRCKSAGLPWYANPTISTDVGSTNATVIMSFNAANWTGISANNGVVECKRDHEDNEADIEASGLQWVKKGSNGYTSSSSFSVRYNWGGTAVILYSGNYLNFRSNPANQTTVETRLAAAKRVTKQIFDSNPGVKFGLMLFNKNTSTSTNGGYVAMSVGNLTDTVTYSGTSMTRLAALKSIIDAINPRPYPSGLTRDGAPSSLTCDPDNGAMVPVECNNSALPVIGTPLAETLWEAKLYISGDTPKYGYPTTAPSPAPDSSAKGSNGKYISPFKFYCQPLYIILITDGNPWVTNDTDADTLIGGLTGKTSAFGNFTYSHSSKMDELAYWMNNNDLISNTILDQDQKAIIYTVGFDLKPGTRSTAAEKEDADGEELLTKVAANGKGTYMTAKTGADLTVAIQSALVDAQTRSSSFAAPSLSINAFNKLFNRDEVYFALFQPEATYHWDGNVKKFKLCANTTAGGCTFGEIIDCKGLSAIDSTTQRIKDSAVSFWGSGADGCGSTADGGTVTSGGAGSVIPSAVASSSARKVYTYYGAYSGLTASSPGPLFQITTSSNSLYNAAINDPTILGLTDSDSPVNPATTNGTDTAAVTKLIKWILGEDIYKNPGSDRWAHSDPLHSRPIALTYGGTSTDPIIKIFYSTNDGLIHMINDKTGAEEWSFLPQEAWIKQYNYSQNPTKEHNDGAMDGTPVFWVYDKNNNGIIEPLDGDYVYMYVGMRRGGKNIYAFNVTPDNKLTDPSVTTGITPKLMWVIEGGKGNFMKLAQTWSKPTVAKIRYGCKGTSCGTDDSSAKTVLIFGGGYDATEDDVLPIQASSPSTNKSGNAIYIVDPLDGSLLWWASDGNDSAGNAPSLPLANMKFSIPSEVALMDSNGDGAVDRLYVGDTGGQLWRIDLSASLGNSQDNTKGFVFADIACKDSSGSTAYVRPNCAGVSDNARRKFFYPPDVAQVLDTQYASTSKYDLVSIGSGDREDPLDLLTINGTTPVHNRIYAFRDFSINSLAGATTLPAVLTENDLHDLTDNQLQDTNNTNYSNLLADFRTKSGWLIKLSGSGNAPSGAPSSWPWVGEKVMAKTVIFNGVLYVTTYTPANNLTAQNTCQPNEGNGKLFAVNYLNGTAAIDFDKSGTLTNGDRTKDLHGGVPSELVTVIREGGTSSIVGTSGGAATPDIGGKLPRFKTYWLEK